MSFGGAGWGAALIAATLLLTPLPLAAQQELAWSEFRPCAECRLVARQLVRLGTESGPGVIEGDLVGVTSAPGRGYIVHGIDGAGGTRFALFDERGGFLRTVGEEGDGPGALRMIGGVEFGKPGEVVVLDADRRRWITFLEDGTFVSEVRGERFEPGRFQLVGDGSTAVVATMGRRPASAGFPLHLVDLRTGNPIRHFGADANPIWSLGEPWGEALNLGRRAGVRATVWWGKVGRPHLEEWTLEGALERRITGPLEWFPLTTVRETMAPSVPPRVAMLGFAVDAADRLWLLTAVPDGRWQQVERRGPEGIIPPEERATYRDARLDVFDLNTRRHLGRLRWDTPHVALFTRGDRVLVQMVEYETPFWPRAVVYEIDVRGPGGAR